MKSSILNQKIRTKMLGLVFLCTTIPLVGLYFINDYLTRASLELEVGRRLESVSERICADLDRLVYYTMENVQIWAESPVIRQVDRPQIGHERRSVFEGIFNNYGIYSGLFLTDRYGVIRGAHDPEFLGRDMSSSPWFTTVRTKKKLCYFDLVPDPVLGLLTLNIAAPIWRDHRQEEFLGVLSVHLSWNEIKTIVEKNKIGDPDLPSGFSLLVNRTGKIIGAPEFKIREEHQRGVSLASRNLAKEGQPAVLQALEGIKGYTIEEESFDGHAHIIGFAPSIGFREFKGLGWAVLSFQQKDVAFSSLSRVRHINQIITLIIILLAVFTFLFLGRRMIQRIDILKQHIQGVGEGDFSFDLSLKKGDEIDDLTRAFKKMTLELKENNQRLIDAKEEAEEANRAKSTFLANISHDLRTPLNGIIGMADILSRSKLSPEHQESVSIILNSGDSLLSLINDLLDVSKIEAGKIQIEREKTNIRLLIEELSQLLGPAAYSKHVEFIVKFEPGIPKFAHLDKGRVRQVLMNLAGNAVKFTSKGTVRLLIGRHGKDLEIQIVDTGIGIHDHHRENLFKPFVQADISSKRNYEGAGLGLYICASLVKAMNGDISFHSKPHLGSTFVVRFPSCLIYPEPNTLLDPRMAIGGAMPDGRALIYSRDERGIRLLIDWLEQYHIPFHLIRDMESMVQKIRSEEHPFFYFLDVGFEEDSKNLLSQITPFMNTKQRPLFLHSANKEMLSETGNIEVLLVHLFKPFVSKYLITIVQECSRSLGMSQPAPVPQDEEIIDHRLILVVEDNRVNYRVAQRMLSRMGFHVEHALNGQEAVELVRGGTKFDLILMDCHMPVMDGWEASKTIRQIEGCQIHPPILALTANALEGTRERCLESGMQGFLTKPVKFIELKTKIENLMGKEAT